MSRHRHLTNRYHVTKIFTVMAVVIPRATGSPTVTPNLRRVSSDEANKLKADWKEQISDKMKA
jgi:hypothetical protein